MDSDRARLIQSEKMSAAGSLLAGIVHELNNPLTTILGFSELLLREGKAVDSNRLEKIHAEAERSVRIIQNALRLSRADEGGQQVIDINESICRTVELARYQLRLNRIELDLALSTETPRVLALPGELTQVFLNLITNAIQAISNVRPSGSIRIVSVVTGGRVRVSVEDDGPGVSEANRRQIFDTFFTTKKTGTGLGLSLSRKIVREIGGEMWVSSGDLCGATFTLDLPIANRGNAAAGTPPDVPMIVTADQSVLIVDDEDHITELVDSVLQTCGYRTDSSNDGEAAIELLKRNEYDILICDLHMRGISGRDLVQWTRSNRRNTRVLILSGDIARKDTGEFARACGAHFLSKPFSVSELTKAVQRLSS